MTDEPDLPPGVGPHEGRELELMLAGQKPLAMFYDAVPATVDLPEIDFAPHVAAGLMVKREEIYKSGRTGTVTRYIYYALPNEVWRIEALHAMQSGFYAGRPATDEDDIEIGRLLGYSEAEIKAFIEWRQRLHTSQQNRRKQVSRRAQSNSRYSIYLANLRARRRIRCT